MASSTSLISFGPASIAASANPKADRKSDCHGRRAGCGSRGSWWTPLFGWPAVPDYVEAATKPAAAEEEEVVVRRRPRRFAALTEEKARELRMRTVEMENFHDVMYHSAIASRLASDLGRRS